MNKPLLRKIIKAIKAEPRRLNMGLWIDQDREAPCGTAACIAGYAILLSRKEPWTEAAKKAHKASQAKMIGYETTAIELLKISEPQADRLFYVSNWPTRYGDAFENSLPDREVAGAIAVKRIEHFIKTGR